MRINYRVKLLSFGVPDVCPHSRQQELYGLTAENIIAHEE